MKKYIGLLSILLPLITTAQLVMKGNYYVVLDGGSISAPTVVVLTDSNASGITNTGSGWIVSENEFNQIAWKIRTNTGNYTVPFGYGIHDYLPVSCNITSAGIGSGSIKFSTYHGYSWNNSLYEPSDVTTMSNFGAADYSNNGVDRFWILDATGYATKPTSAITLSYIRSGSSSEIADPNYIVESSLIAQRFNSSSEEWNDWYGATGTNTTSANTGTVSTGALPASEFYRSWCLFNDSTLLLSVPTISGITSPISIYPNPTKGNVTIAGLEKGQVIELYNYFGQLLLIKIAGDMVMHLDISDKASGVYLIRIKNKEGSLVTEKKIVKVQ